ncbi:unnamed protein product [Diabrotica balteata]|uniref:C2H2-type domain-containing protein n=1 Tax=Diabrotica balteata TaxID=107213 RepID=A0A9N9STR1_DIABA|nr:unnamed protein product [Diabrotica balteata]
MPDSEVGTSENIQESASVSNVNTCERIKSESDLTSSLNVDLQARTRGRPKSSKKDNEVKQLKSQSKGRNIKFESVIIKVNDQEVFSIPEYPDVKIKVVKGGKHPYMCPKCDLGFWTKTAYEAHQPVHILKKAKQPIKKFRCDICAKEFSKLCDVERHTRVHTGEKPCICNICNKRFQQAHNLSKHLLTHLHIKPFYCEICNKKFGRNDVLRRHLLTHSVDKPVKCSVCHRGFIRHSQLLQHMRRKHPRHPVEDVSESYADPNESDSSETKDDGFDNEPSTSKFKNNSHDK